jgi:hypothetical protein
MTAQSDLPTARGVTAPRPVMTTLRIAFCICQGRTEHVLSVKARMLRHRRVCTGHMCMHKSLSFGYNSHQHYHMQSHADGLGDKQFPQ